MENDTDNCSLDHEHQLLIGKCESRTPKSCSGNSVGSHAFDYGKLGFSPCGEYVSHENNQPCAPLPVNTGSINLDNCTCKTESCPCGEFVSHKVIETCTATA